MSKLVITLRDTHNELKDFHLVYKVRNNDLAKLWKKQFKKNIIDSKHPIEKNYCLQGWIDSWESDDDRNLNYLCHKLNQHIQILNTELKQFDYPHIDLNFTVEALKEKSSQEDLLNKIHHHFETLIGQVWDVSEWYKLPLSDRCRFSIRMLNNYCHEIESCISGIETGKKSITFSLNGLNEKGEHFLNKDSAQLNLNEFLCFDNQVPFGSITLYYAQLGKSHYEVFVDNDNDIDRKNISGIQLVTGEFRIPFYESRGDLQDENFVSWLQEHNWDIDDPSLSLKHGVVADLEMLTPKSYLLEQIALRNDISQIALDGVRKQYNYTYKEQEQWESQI